MMKLMQEGKTQLGNGVTNQLICHYKASLRNVIVQFCGLITMALIYFFWSRSNNLRKEIWGEGKRERGGEGWEERGENGSVHFDYV